MFTFCRNPREKTRKKKGEPTEGRGEGRKKRKGRFTLPTLRKEKKIYLGQGREELGGRKEKKEKNHPHLYEKKFGAEGERLQGGREKAGEKKGKRKGGKRRPPYSSPKGKRETLLGGARGVATGGEKKKKKERISFQSLEKKKRKKKGGHQSSISLIARKEIPKKEWTKKKEKVAFERKKFLAILRKRKSGEQRKREGSFFSETDTTY